MRLSRSAVDDSINQNLNALLTPSRRAFDPSSTAQRSSRPRDNKAIAASECDGFCKAKLFPAWEARSIALQYCKKVAAAEDSADPDRELIALEKQRDSEREINERVDPYSARFNPRESRTEKLARTVHIEEEIEDIVRRRTWEVVQNKCAVPLTPWQAAVEQWKKNRN